MRLIIIFPITILIFYCTNPINEDRPNKYQLTNTFKNHLAEDNLSGPVSTVTLSSCNENADSCCLTGKVTYNSSGNRIKEIAYNCSDPDLIIVDEWYWYDYYYDSLGRLTNRVQMEDETTKVYEWIDEYDTTDLASRRYYVDHWTTGDSTIQLLSYDSLERWTGYEEHQIEDWGIDETVYSSLTIIFNENENSKTSEWKIRNDTYRTHKVIYNEKGLMVEFIVRDVDDTVLDHEYYEYILFDNNGNWTTRILTGNKGNKTIEKREIEYY